MQPKNKAERAKAFVNFLLLFLLCIAIIITTVFFSIQVPIKQNDDLRNRFYVVQKERELMSDFITEMEGIAVMLDTINNNRFKADLLDGEIAARINKLQLRIDADSTSHKILYKDIVQNMIELKLARKQLREVNSKDEEFIKLKDEITNYREQLQRCEATKNALMGRGT